MIKLQSLTRTLTTCLYVFFAACVIVLGTHAAKSQARCDQPVKIVALGDSITAGYGLTKTDSYPSLLEQDLRQQFPKLEIINAGVSGDTTAGGLARLEWSVPSDAQAIIVALGANDMLRNLPVANAQQNLQQIIQKLKAQNKKILLVGMRATSTYGDAYAQAFNTIYTGLSKTENVALYPFLLEGVALNPAHNLPDGIHPNAQGTRIIANAMRESVAKLIESVCRAS